MIESGMLCPEQPDTFTPVVHALLDEGDQYMLLADFEAYIECQGRVSAAYATRRIGHACPS